MNNLIQAHLDGIETSLTALLESISTYNPSIPAATALLAADDSLQASLKTLQTHQKNHSRILHLREKIDKQNAQITDTLTLLAETRADLLSTPTSLPKEDRRDVPYRDLLDYAKRISRYSIPPNLRHSIPKPQALATKTVEETAGDDVADGDGDGDGGGKEEGDEAEKESFTLKSLGLEERNWLDPVSGVVFTPWPSEEVIKRGALAMIQGMLEKGDDPEGIGRQGLDQELGEDGVEGKVEEEEKVMGREDVAERAREAEGTGTRVERREEKPKVFGGLDLYDPEND